MNYKSKYIIIEQGAMVYPIVFGDLMGHDDMARNFAQKPTSAGFCFINDDGKYTCYGKSVSLKLESRGEKDSQILNKFLGVTQEY